MGEAVQFLLVVEGDVQIHLFQTAYELDRTGLEVHDWADHSTLVRGQVDSRVLTPWKRKNTNWSLTL